MVTRSQALPVSANWMQLVPAAVGEHRRVSVWTTGPVELSIQRPRGTVLGRTQVDTTLVPNQQPPQTTFWIPAECSLHVRLTGSPPAGNNVVTIALHG